MFSQHVGLNPKAIQRVGRILDACASLRSTSCFSIAEIAQATRFYDHAAFTHAFTQHLGISPTQFRAEPITFFERRPGA